MLQTNSPSVVLAALTADHQSLVSSCGTPPGGDFCISCGAYPNTNMDAIWVSLTSDIPTTLNCVDNQTNKNWRIVASARDGNGTQTNSTAISIPSGVPGMYYVRLQRTSPGQAMVSVFSNSGFSTHLTGSPQCLSIPGIVSDLDVLTHEVHAQGGCRRVFNGVVDHLKIDNGVTCPTPLTASVTAPTSICEGDPIVVSGTSSGTPWNASHYIWAVEECDVNGNQFGPVWWGTWTAGASTGNFTLPYASLAAAGVHVTCGKYYKVTLGVQNCGNPWAAASKVIRVDCPPTVNLHGSSSYFCPGDPAGITAGITGGSGNYTMIVEQMDPFYGIIYNGPPASVMVYPTVTTTYQVVVYDNVTGCMTVVPWTITSAAIDPSFSIFANTSNPSYFTVSVTPNDLNAHTIPGFIYGYNIEELDASNNPYYSTPGTDCWWNYPNPETFLGFLSTSTGVFNYTNTLPWYPACTTSVGIFLHNHRYRITRLVANDYCPVQQYSFIAESVKSGQVIFEPDPKAPDMTHLLKAPPVAEAAHISIFPNPSDGHFTIDLGNKTTSAQIIVTDALGRQVKTLEQQGSQTELDLSAFAKGLYTVTIVANGAATVRKVVVE